LVETEFADVIDIHINTLDLSPLPEHDHTEECPGLCETETNCNYLADRANLCAQKNSQQWYWFADCMLQLNLKGDAFNPLANVSTFDPQLDTCAQAMSDYSLEDFKGCVYGAEGDELRVQNRQLTAKIYADLDMEPEVVWALIDGNYVTDPSTEGMGNSRANWQKKLGPAVCAAYSGPKVLSSCSSLEV